MEKFLALGDRIKQERLRLGMTQTGFAALVNTTKQTLFSWETGKTAPDAFQLTVLANFGVDTVYVLTGQRTIPVSETLNEQELALLAAYRRASEESKKAIRTLCTALK